MNSRQTIIPNHILHFVVISIVTIEGTMRYLNMQWRMGNAIRWIRQLEIRENTLRERLDELMSEAESDEEGYNRNA